MGKSVSAIVFSSIMLMPLVAAAQSVRIESISSSSGTRSFVSGIVSRAVATSSSGGFTVVGGEAASSSSASVEVRNVIRAEGSNTRVEVDVRTESNGVEERTSIERAIAPGERLEIRMATSGASSVISTAAENAAERPFVVPEALDLPSLSVEGQSTTSLFGWSGSEIIARFRATFTDIFRRIFEFW